MQTITAVLDIQTSNYNTLIRTGIKYNVLINITKRQLTIILVYYTNVLCREEKGCNNIIKMLFNFIKIIYLAMRLRKEMIQCLDLQNSLLNFWFLF